MTDTNRSIRTPILGCIADDVTGATDLATNLVQGGLRVVQISDVIVSDTTASVSDSTDITSYAHDVDAVVIALKTRSTPADQAIQQSLSALNALQALGIGRFYFKYCSTFDSTPQGNIGPVAEALMHALSVSQTIYCPAFPQAGRTVYNGHLFVGDTLLNESGMQHHPLNPMTDANLVRCLERQLSQQSTGSVGLLDHATIAAGARISAQKLNALTDEAVAHVVTDTCHEGHLNTLAELAATMPLVTGGSGLARFLPRIYRARGILNSATFVPSLPNIAGRKAIIAGSCSQATQTQVKWMQDTCASWTVDVAALMVSPAAELHKLRTWISTTDATQPLLIASTADPQQITDLQNRFDATRVATAVENHLSSAAKILVEEFGVRCLVVAGGETSGAVTRTLGVQALDIGPEICTGVPWTSTIGRKQPLAFALKSGNFGDEQFFGTALEMLV